MSADDPRARALGYPYERLAASWVLTGPTGARRARPSTAADLAGATRDRVAVLAIGANAAPSQLARKFADGSWGEVPVLTTELADHDVVYAARVSEYGAVPATRWRSPGTTVAVHTTFLTPAQLTRMDRTEGHGRGYQRVLVPSSLVQVDGIPPVTVVHSYDATAGALAVDGRPVALAAIRATGRTTPELDEPAVLGWVAAQHSCTRDELLQRLLGPAGSAERDHLRAWLAGRALTA